MTSASAVSAVLRRGGLRPVSSRRREGVFVHGSDPVVVSVQIDGSPSLAHRIAGDVEMILLDAGYLFSRRNEQDEDGDPMISFGVSGKRDREADWLDVAAAAGAEIEQHRAAMAAAAARRAAAVEKLVASGMSKSEIARRLGVTPGAISNLRPNARKKGASK